MAMAWAAETRRSREGRPSPKAPAAIRTGRYLVPGDTDSAILGDALARIRAHELETVVPLALCKVAAASALDAAEGSSVFHSPFG